MTKGICTRCGAEESVFWYPYAFGVAPIPVPAGTMSSRDSQFFILCDKCQTEFIKFMNMKPSGYYIKKDADYEDSIREVMDQ